MKLLHIITIILIVASDACYGVAQRKMHARGYYLSHSPYYTDGYLGARANRKHLYYGPSPYSYTVNLSGTTHPTLHKREYRKSIDIEDALVTSEQPVVVKEF